MTTSDFGSVDGSNTSVLARVEATTILTPTTWAILRKSRREGGRTEEMPANSIEKEECKVRFIMHATRWESEPGEIVDYQAVVFLEDVKCLPDILVPRQTGIVVLQKAFHANAKKLVILRMQQSLLGQLNERHVVLER